MNGNTRIEICYPSFSKKAITFTIDDGNVPHDVKFLSIVRPAGIKGTFNLCSDRITTYGADFYRELYRGYEIANHCKYHPFVSYDGCEYRVSPEPFDESTADPCYIYPVADREGFYYVKKPNGWRIMVMEDDFLRYVEEGKRELCEIFGEGSVRDFVWPFCEQDNAAAKSKIKELHRSSRKTGCTLGSDGFNIPEDKYAWSYCADDVNLLEVMERYEKYPDDGRLKLFAFGVHSFDFERRGTWCNLEQFASKYGSRPGDYWYACVGEIFDYEDAVMSLKITEKGVFNPTDTPIYIKINGEKRIVSPLGVCEI